MSLRYFKPTMKKTLGNAGDQTKLLWFHGSAKYTQPGGGQCVGDLSRRLKDEEIKRIMWRRLAAPERLAYLNNTLLFYIFSFDLCILKQHAKLHSSKQHYAFMCYLKVFFVDCLC